MSKYPLNYDEGELTDAELRRLIDEAVQKRMQIVCDQHLASYWAARNKHDEQQERERLRGLSNPSTPDKPFPPYDPSELHEIRDIITEEVRRRVIAMLKFPLHGEDR